MSPSAVVSPPDGDAVVVDVLDEHLPAAERRDLDDLRPAVAWHEAERAAAAQLARHHRASAGAALPLPGRAVLDASAAAHTRHGQRQRHGEGKPHAA